VCNPDLVIGHSSSVMGSSSQDAVEVKANEPEDCTGTELYSEGLEAR